MKEYKLITETHIEHLLEDLNEQGQDGWRYIDGIHQHGVIKILLERNVSLIKSFKRKLKPNVIS